MRVLSWRDLPIGRKAVIVIAIPVLPLIVTAGLYLASSDAYDRARAATDRAAQGRVTQTRLFTMVVEAESAARGYLLSGDTRHLERHRRVRGDIGALLGELEGGLQDPAQRRRLPRVRALVNARLQALDAVLQTPPVGLTSARLQANLALGLATIDDLRVEMDQLRQGQERVLVERNERVRLARARADNIVRIGAGIGILGGFAAVILFTAGITRRIDRARENMSRLARREALVPVRPDGDELGTLTVGIEQAAGLLDERDRLLARRMEELEALTRELEAFSYSVSHDLRAPLRHIAGFATMLQKSAGDALTDQQRRYITTIVQAAARMGNLIDDLLAFSRTGRTELRQVPVDITGLVEDVQQQLTADINGRQVRWVMHPLPGVVGDPAMLRVVFDNLLANAVKYTRPRDQAEIEIGSRPGEDGQAVVYVRDNGVGFDMQYQNKLFGVFQRLHSSDDFEGTGIGLATVRRIVTRHGGRTWAEGRPGEGATFYISLPTASREHAA